MTIPKTKLFYLARSQILCVQRKRLCFREAQRDLIISVLLLISYNYEAKSVFCKKFHWPRFIMLAWFYCLCGMESFDRISLTDRPWAQKGLLRSITLRRIFSFSLNRSLSRKSGNSISGDFLPFCKKR